MTSAHKTNSTAQCRGFTLLELITVILIISVIFGSSIFFLSRSDKNDISHLPRKFEKLSKSTLTKARLEKKTHYIIFTHDKVTVVQSIDQTNKGTIPEMSSSELSMTIPKDVSIAIRKSHEKKWTWLNKNSDPVIWVFSISGICEELSIILKNEDSEMQATFHPLTGLIISDS